MPGRRVIALSGGVGGAKLALGLSRVLPAGDLTVIVNTGDDFEHLGLAISPDIDTLLYTLAGLDNPITGWGQRDESWQFMVALEALGGATWFRLGDRDLATHVERTRRLNAGETLSQVTDDFRRRFGIAARMLPMSDDPVRTHVRTAQAWLDFQDYFVRHRCDPAITEIAFKGADVARPHPEFLAALRDPGPRGCHLPVESVHKHRTDPGPARRPRDAARLRRAGDCGRADHRRPRRQRPHREDDAGARDRSQRRRGRDPL
jgi:LPPG:FO 2-phospho-L-lactate transferase